MSDREDARCDGDVEDDGAASATAVPVSKTTVEPTTSATTAGTETTPSAGGDAAPKPLSTKIDELRALQAEMLAARKRVSKDLRNFEKRRKRLKTNARRLSNDDLAEVILMREATQSTAESSAETSASSSTASPKKKAKTKAAEKKP